MKYTKYIFAAFLVLLALIMVFHVEKLLPIPDTLGRVVSSWLAPVLPFSVKTAYADSCISGMEAKQGKIQYAVSESAIRLKEMDRQIESRREQLEKSVARLRVLLNSPDAAESIGREVQRHDELQNQIAHAQTIRGRLEATINSLEKSEGEASQRVGELKHRLEIVKLDHQRNDAQELSAELAGANFPGRSSLVAHGVKTVEALEHQERVREEWYRRYGAAEPNEVQKDFLQRAQEILAQEQRTEL